MEKFKKYYQFPLQLISPMVWTSSNLRAFDFMLPWLRFPDEFYLSDEDQQKIVEVINGERKPKTDVKPRYQDGYVFVTLEGVEKKLLLVRGGGMLTGTGSFRLNSREAVEIQDEFGEYIVEQLKVKQNGRKKRIQ